MPTWKEFTDSLDKLTDILNVGRLIFYTAAGFCATLPCAMTLRLLSKAHPQPYWTQFLADMSAGSRRVEVWLVALVAGFFISSVAFTLVKLQQPPARDFDTESYDYQYPRLFSGGVRPESSKDYAAWLISEYYRYLEIVWYIPAGILVALPVWALYSLVYLARTWQAGSHAFGEAHLAFGLWTLAAVLAWDVVWPRFWVPSIIQPLYEEWCNARHAAIHGLRAFVKESAKSAPVQVPPPPPPVKGKEASQP
ncbi:MAG: hypothetical protein JOZ15_00480 [Acidobacteria bacterium]|nr:hypothetical protein [Acidobacteriota bacterium]